MASSWFSKSIDRAKKALKSTTRWFSNHPVMAIGMGAVLVLIGIQSSFGIVSYRENSAALARVIALPETNLKVVMADADGGKVDRIITHSVQDGSWASPRLRHFMEIVNKNGAHTRLEDQRSMGEEFQTRITQAAIKNPIVFDNGFDASNGNKITEMISLLLFLGVLVLVLLAAQMLVGETLAGHSFRPQAKDDNLSLDDVVGYDEVKRELREVMDQLIHAEAYAKHGVRAPRGMLFTGDPGVGKTMMAKAMANELKAEFFYCTGADFAEMYVGVGPRRVRALFRRARQSKRAFIFIDEIDALGSRATMGNDSERLGTLNQMLSELDGINSNGQILVLGATNFAERLDAALIRPGRFDKKIHIPLPNRDTRRLLIERKLSGAVLDGGIDFEALADRTEGYSGAQIVSFVDEARNLALRDAGGNTASSHPKLSQEVLERAQEIAMLGVSENKMGPEEEERASVHELGHALLGYLRCENSYVEKVTIRGRGGSLGYTISRPQGDRKLRTEENIRGEISMFLAGRAAEQVMLGSVSSGASDDLRRANSLARDMVCFLGMGGRTGLMSFLDAGQPGVSMPKSMEEDISQLLNAIYIEVVEILEQNREWLTFQTAELLRLGLLGHNAMFVAHPPIREKASLASAA